MSRKEAARPGLVRAALKGTITNAAGAESLGISVRQFKRLKAAYRQQGLRGLQHGNRDRLSPRRLDSNRRLRIVELMTHAYAGLNDHHLTEKLHEIEGIDVSREVVRRIRLTEKLPARRRRRAPKHRIRRERHAQPGALVLVDGSQHRWLEDRHPMFTLQGAVDDATGQLLQLVVRPHEDLHGYVQLLHDILESHGVPLTLYGDRFGALIRNDDHWTLEEQLAGRQSPTHFGAMLEDLGIAFIAAHSPQAKGRIERVWGTLQDRLVAELRLHRISTLEHTMAFLPPFIADYNRRFVRPARAHDTAWRLIPRHADHILACRYQRVVARDNTVSIPGRWIQLPARGKGRSWHPRRVEVRELLDGRMRVIWQDQLVAEQAADTALFTLVPRSASSGDRAARYDCSPRPRPPQPIRKATPKPTPPRRPRSKPGKAWRGFRYGALLTKGGT